MKAPLTAALICTTTLSVAAVEKVLHVERLGPEDGLAHNAVTATLEDHLGYLWFGTEDGLQRYDGVTFETFRAGAGQMALSHSEITALYEATDDSLWIGTTNGLNILDADRSTLLHARLEGSEETLAIGSIDLAPSGIITVSSTNHGILEAHRETGGVVLRPLVPSARTIFHHSWRPNGELLVIRAGEFGVELARFDVAGREQGVKRLPARLTRKRDFAFPQAGPGNPGRLDAGVFTDGERWLHAGSYLREESGSWIATTAGLFYLSAGQWNAQRIQLSGGGVLNVGLGSEIMSLTRDRAGALWLGTYRGVLRADPAAREFTHFPGPLSTSADPISSLFAPTGGDTVFAGTYGNGLLELSLANTRIVRRIRPHDISNGRCSDYVWSGLITADNRLLAVTSAATCIFSAEGELHQVIPGSPRRAAGTETGKVWISGNSKLLLINSEGELERSFSLRGEAMQPLPSGKLWIGPVVETGAYHESTVKRLDPESGSIQNYRLPWEVSVYDLNAPDDDTLLLATSGGLLHLNADTGIATKLLSELQIGTAYSLTREDKNLLWLGTGRGIVRVDLSTQPPSTKHFGVDQGLENIEFNRHARMVTESGRFLLGGMQGVTAFYPANIRGNSYAPPTRLKWVQVEGPDGLRTYPGSQEVALTPQDYAIDFQFVALNFTRSVLNRYRYRLHGIDQAWVEAGKQQSARYAGLSPGAYTFEVIGSNDDGVWSKEPVLYQFEVQPAYYETWWFRATILALALTLLSWLYKIRVNRRLAMKRMRLRIASDLHDELGSELSGIALASAIVGRNAELSSDDRGRLSDVEQTSHRVMEGLRDIVWYVNPEHDNFDSLVDRMRATARRLSGDVKVSFEIKGRPRDSDLNMQARRQLFLAFKELLTNALRHANGTRVDAELNRTGRALELTVVDNGSGFDPATTVDGTGLPSLRRRTKRLGGALAVDSTPQGTRASISIPVT